MTSLPPFGRYIPRSGRKELPRLPFFLFPFLFLSFTIPQSLASSSNDSCSFIFPPLLLSQFTLAFIDPITCFTLSIPTSLLFFSKSSSTQLPPLSPHSHHLWEVFIGNIFLLSSLLSSCQSHILQFFLYRAVLKETGLEVEHSPSNSLEEVPKGMAEAFKLYGNPRSQAFPIWNKKEKELKSLSFISAVVLMIVQPTERNVVDQSIIELELLEKWDLSFIVKRKPIHNKLNICILSDSACFAFHLFRHGIHLMRKTLSEVASQGKLDSDRKLTMSLSLSPPKDSKLVFSQHLLFFIFLEKVMERRSPWYI